MAEVMYHDCAASRVPQRVKHFWRVTAFERAPHGKAI